MSLAGGDLPTCHGSRNPGPTADHHNDHNHKSKKHNNMFLEQKYILPNNKTDL